MSQTETSSEAVKRLFEDYADEVYQYLRFTLGRPSEAEDIVQDVFLEALRAWPRFEGRSSEKTWLWSIIRHKMVDRLRQRQRGRAETSAQVGEGASEDVDIAATRVDLERSLQRLPLAQRQVFILRIIQDKSSSEVSQLLGWSNVKVRVTLHRALKLIGKYMETTQAFSKGGASNEGF